MYLHLYNETIVAVWGRNAEDSAVLPMPAEAAHLPLSQRWVFAAAQAVANHIGALDRLPPWVEFCAPKKEEAEAKHASWAIRRDAPGWPEATREIADRLDAYGIVWRVKRQTSGQRAAIVAVAEKAMAESLAVGIGGVVGTTAEASRVDRAAR
jgi:hypothetical protein